MRNTLILTALIALFGSAQAAEDCAKWKEKLVDAFPGSSAPRGLTIGVKVNKDGQAELNIPRTNFSDVWLRVTSESCGIDVAYVKRCRVNYNASKWTASCQLPELAADVAALPAAGWKLSSENNRLDFKAEM